MLVGVACPAVADAVAFGNGAVQQDEFGVCFAQDQQSRGSLGEQVDDRAGVGVGGGVADPESGGDLRQGGVLIADGPVLPPSRDGTSEVCSAGHPRG